MNNLRVSIVDTDQFSSSVIITWYLNKFLTNILTDFIHRGYWVTPRDASCFRKLTDNMSIYVAFAIITFRHYGKRNTFHYFIISLFAIIIIHGISESYISRYNEWFQLPKKSWIIQRWRWYRVSTRFTKRQVFQ